MTHYQHNKVLVVDDDPQLVIMLQYQLEAMGFAVVSTGRGEQALALYHHHGPFAVIVLDVNLQEKDGFRILQDIREVDHRTGILMLTARHSDKDKIRGLKLGADDYLCKPFNNEELMVRILRMASRSELMGEAYPVAEDLSFGPFRLNRAELKLYTGHGVKALTVLEVDLLSCFVQHQGKVLSRDYLLRNVWGLKGQAKTRTVDNHIVKLRRYLEVDPALPQYIVSVRGRGYKLVIG